MAVRGRRVAKSALFEHVGYQPHPLQLEVHLSTARRRYVAAGTRAGKSMIAQYECLAAVLAPCERSRGWVVGPTLDTPDRILQHVRLVLETYFPHRVRSYDAKTRTLVVTNLQGGRSEVRSKSTDSTAGLLGESLTYLICDEAASVRRSDWEVCCQRLVDQGGWSLAVSVPKGAGWFFDAYRSGLRGRDPESKSWTAPTWANPAISREVIDAERARLSADDFREQFGGEFVGVATEPCITCNGPRASASGIAIIDRDAGEHLLRCSECSLPVDKHGDSLVTVWPNGKSHILVVEGISLQKRPSLDEFLDVPGSSPK